MTKISLSDHHNRSKLRFISHWYYCNIDVSINLSYYSGDEGENIRYHQFRYQCHCKDHYFPPSPLTKVLLISLKYLMEAKRGVSITIKLLQYWHRHQYFPLSLLTKSPPRLFEVSEWLRQREGVIITILTYRQLSHWSQWWRRTKTVSITIRSIIRWCGYIETDIKIQ